MSEELDKQIGVLQNKYYSDVELLYNSYLRQYHRVIQYHIPYFFKKYYVKRLTSQYKNNKNILENKLISDIRELKEQFAEQLHNQPTIGTKKALVICCNYRGTPNELND